jgi:hypothetical protein
VRKTLILKSSPEIREKKAAAKLLNNRFPFQPCKIALLTKDTGFAEETFFQSNLFIVVFFRLRVKR